MRYTMQFHLWHAERMITMMQQQVSHTLRKQSNNCNTNIKNRTIAIQNQSKLWQKIMGYSIKIVEIHKTIDQLHSKIGHKMMMPSVDLSGEALKIMNSAIKTRNCALKTINLLIINDELCNIKCWYVWYRIAKLVEVAREHVLVLLQPGCILQWI